MEPGLHLVVHFSFPRLFFLLGLFSTLDVFSLGYFFSLVFSFLCNFHFFVLWSHRCLYNQAITSNLFDAFFLLGCLVFVDMSAYRVTFWLKGFWCSYKGSRKANS